MFVMKDNKVGPAHLKIASSPSYTLAEIEQLARGFVNVTRADTYDRMLLSRFTLWLKQQAKREQGEVRGQ